MDGKRIDKHKIARRKTIIIASASVTMRIIMKVLIIVKIFFASFMKTVTLMTRWWISTMMEVRLLQL